MEKKRIKELKKEREILEKQLQHHSEEAGLVARALPPGMNMYSHLYPFFGGRGSGLFPPTRYSVKLHGNSL